MLFNDKVKSHALYTANHWIPWVPDSEHKCGQADYAPMGRYVKLDSNKVVIF